MSIAIKVESLSKQYRLGQVGRRTLNHDINRWWHKARGKEDPYLKIGQENDRSKKGTSDYVWSLRDVDFEVNQGDVLGIIGCNGAGKSTLLKILSKVTAPTSGEVKINGRIASLLEVGTGFHPDLSGRDNIYLNGAILGMTKNEITRKFDEIVSFAGVERYIDTPVKRYSSGMYVRLAFAVAAHLEPDILIVDEVLAVGDAEFQKKCLGKMKDVSVKEGRTVLFVSHNLSSIENLCNKGILLDKGKLFMNATASHAVSEYIRLNSRKDGYEYIGDRIIRNAQLKFSKVDESYKSNMEIVVSFESSLPLKNIVLGIVIKDLFDTPLIGVNNKHYLREPLNATGLQKAKLFAKFKDLALMPGEYKVDIFLGDSVVDVESIENALSFSIEDTSVHDTATPLDYRLNKMFIKEVNWGVLPN